MRSSQTWTTVLGGFTGIIVFSVLLYGLSLVVMPHGTGGAYGVAFPYLTHPLGWCLGIIGSGLLSRGSDSNVSVKQMRLQGHILVIGAILSPFMLLITGPVLILIFSVIDKVVGK